MFHQVNYTGSYESIHDNRLQVARLVAEGCHSQNLSVCGKNYFIGLSEKINDIGSLAHITSRKVQRIDKCVLNGLKDLCPDSTSYWLVTDFTVTALPDNIKDNDKPIRFYVSDSKCGIKQTILCCDTVITRAALKTITSCVEDYYYNNSSLGWFDFFDMIDEEGNFKCDDSILNFLPLRLRTNEYSNEALFDLVSTAWCDQDLKPDRLSDIILHNLIKDTVCESVSDYDVSVIKCSSTIFDRDEIYHVNQSSVAEEPILIGNSDRYTFKESLKDGLVIASYTDGWKVNAVDAFSNLVDKCVLL